MDFSDHDDDENPETEEEMDPLDNAHDLDSYLQTTACGEAPHSAHSAMTDPVRVTLHRTSQPS